MKHAALRACRSRLVWLLAPLLLSCGDEDVRLVLPPEEPELEPVPPDPAPPGTGTPQLPELPAPPVGIADERTIESTLRQEPLAQGVVRLLQSNCGSCHGGNRDGDVLGDPSDVAGQIRRGNIVPGSAAQSPLLQRLLENDGHLTGRSVPTPGELALLTRFIDQLPTAPPEACAPLPFQSVDALYAALLADVSSAPAEERPFLRYAGLTYASNAGWCGAALERQRAALFKLVNGVSTAAEIVVPSAVDEGGLLYRLDLRDYGWNRSIAHAEEGAAPFADGWAAIVASAGVYALELQGTEADALKRETGTLVPYLPAHALLHAAAGEAYYALLGLPASMHDTELLLGIDVDQQILDGLVPHAGFTSQRTDAIVRRFEQSARPGRYYWLLDTENDIGSESIYEDPFGFRSPISALFHLPNGSLASQIEDSYRTNDTLASTHSPAREVASCHACHQAGILPATDMVRDIVEANQSYYDTGTLMSVRQLYLPPSEFDALIDADNQLHTAALERGGVSPSAADPLSYVYYQFELDSLSLPRVAAELGVTPEVLLAQLPQLAARLRAVEAPGGSISRRFLDESYAQSLCILHTESRNRPVSCPQRE